MQKKSTGKSIKRVSKSSVKKPDQKKSPDTLNIFGISIEKKSAKKTVEIISKIVLMLSALGVGKVLYKKYVAEVLHVMKTYNELQPGPEKKYLLEEVLGKGKNPTSIPDRYFGSGGAQYIKTRMSLYPSLEGKIPKEDYDALVFMRSMKDLEFNNSSEHAKYFNLILLSSLYDTVRKISYRILKMKKQ